MKTKLLEENGIEAIFSHLRNLLMATVVIAAGFYGLRKPADVTLVGVLDLGIAGVGVVAIGVLLVGLNLLDGYHKLTRLGISMTLRIALVGLYIFVSLRLVQFLVLLRAG